MASAAAAAIPARVAFVIVVSRSAAPARAGRERFREPGELRARGLARDRLGYRVVSGSRVGREPEPLVSPVAVRAAHLEGLVDQRLPAEPRWEAERQHR